MESGVGIVQPAEDLAGAVDHGEGILAKSPAVGAAALVAHATAPAVGVVMSVVPVADTAPAPVSVAVILGDAVHAGIQSRRGQIGGGQIRLTEREKLFFHADSSLYCILCTPTPPASAVGSLAVYAQKLSKGIGKQKNTAPQNLPWDGVRLSVGKGIAEAAAGKLLQMTLSVRNAA